MSVIGVLEWGTDYWGEVMSEPSEEHARNVAKDGNCGLYNRPPMGRWKLVAEVRATTPTGILIIDCGQCGRTHPETRRHCKGCGKATVFVSAGQVCISCNYELAQEVPE